VKVAYAILSASVVDTVQYWLQKSSLKCHPYLALQARVLSHTRRPQWASIGQRPKVKILNYLFIFADDYMIRVNSCLMTLSAVRQTSNKQDRNVQTKTVKTEVILNVSFAFTLRQGTTGAIQVIGLQVCLRRKQVEEFHWRIQEFEKGGHMASAKREPIMGV